jgi:uncharacterized protein (TIGR02246 family)
MRRTTVVVGLLAGFLVVISQFVLSQSEKKEQAQPAARPEQKRTEDGPTPERSADEAAIRANVQAFVRAYNAGDAKAVAALFTPEALIVGKDETTSQGRAAIEETFKELFADEPHKRLEVSVDSIRFIGPDLAVEVGTTKEISAPGEAPESDRYTVLHVKRDGKWRMALARETEGEPPTSHEQLRPLAWLVGEWIDDGGNVVVRSTCRWSDDGNFLLQEFNLQIGERDAQRVTQRIGWDPLAKRIRSWVFDSDGGFGESVWARDGDAWIIKATAIRPDGTTASATNVLVQTGPDSYVWRSTDRIVGGEVVPSTEVKVIRKPPQPKP